MEQPQATPEQALSILDQATQPANITKLTRVDFINIQGALQLLEQFVQKTKASQDAHPPAQAPAPAESGAPAKPGQ